MRKVALGVVAALLLAAFPLSLSTASAVTNAHVRFINQNAVGGPAIDIYVDGQLIVKGLPPGGSFGNWFETDALGNGLHTLQVCVAGGGLALTAGGNCANGLGPLGPETSTPPGNNTGGVALNLVGSTNYTVVLGGVVATNGPVLNLFTGVNDTSPTDFGFTRITIHNTLDLRQEIGNGAWDLCVDGDKVLTQILPGTSQQVEVEAQQQANFQLFPSPVPETAACSGASKTVNLVAGTNFVVTLAANFVPGCTTDCAQVLFVDQERHPNTPSASAFCAVIPSLATVQGEFKSTLGGVNPADHFTYPSSGDVKKLADDITALVSTGDFTVTNDIKPQWEVISAGLRTLVQSLQLVNYDVSGFPVVTQNGDHVTLEQIVEAANGFKLPGVPTPALDGAIAALTAWFKANCVAPPTIPPVAPPAPPNTMSPRFTG